MKYNLSYFFVVILTSFTIMTPSAQVEVRSTSPNSVLDINSPNKAILLPRINNTNLVTSPEEGLFVYNKASNSPSYHDGNQWNNVGAKMMPTSDIDSLTYTVLVGYNVPGSPDLATGTYPLSNFTVDIPQSFPGPFLFNIEKSADLSTTALIRLYAENISNSIQLEINVYKSGASTPYFSYKFTDLDVEYFGMVANNGGLGQTEIYTFTAQISGWKDHVNNLSIAYNASGNMVNY